MQRLKEAVIGGLINIAAVILAPIVAPILLIRWHKRPSIWEHFPALR